jgi:hypothetical protein
LEERATQHLFLPVEEDKIQRQDDAFVTRSRQRSTGCAPRGISVANGGEGHSEAIGVRELVIKMVFTVAARPP